MEGALCEGDYSSYIEFESQNISYIDNCNCNFPVRRRELEIEGGSTRDRRTLFDEIYGYDVFTYSCRGKVVFCCCLFWYLFSERILFFFEKTK